jgi:hypothetical protein
MSNLTSKKNQYIIVRRFTDQLLQAYSISYEVDILIVVLPMGTA